MDAGNKSATRKGVEQKRAYTIAKTAAVPGVSCGIHRCRDLDAPTIRTVVSNKPHESSSAA